MKIQCVSRLHVELIVDENSDATLINRSINGTVLNGKVLNKNGQSSLKHNDRFTVGNREFRFSKGATVQPKSACFAPAGPDEITAELMPIMKAEYPKRIPTNDALYDYFIERARKNLHTCMCFSPVSAKFRQRALKFPAVYVDFAPRFCPLVLRDLCLIGWCGALSLALALVAF